MAVLLIVIMSFMQIASLTVKERVFAIFAGTIKLNFLLKFVMTESLMKKDANPIV